MRLHLHRPHFHLPHYDAEDLKQAATTFAMFLVPALALAGLVAFVAGRAH